MEIFNAQISREQAAAYGRQAVDILQAGHYQPPSGRVVRIADLVEQAVQGTRAYPPETTLPDTHRGPHHTLVEVTNETTLAAVHRLRTAGHHPVALNFASATHPGGGFLTGALAQEEYLARSSGLYACLRDQPMYRFHQARYDPL